jgi:hypothetical protein
MEESFCLLLEMTAKDGVLLYGDIRGMIQEVSGQNSCVIQDMRFSWP